MIDDPTADIKESVYGVEVDDVVKHMEECREPECMIERVVRWALTVGKPQHASDIANVILSFKAMQRTTQIQSAALACLVERSPNNEIEIEAKEWERTGRVLTFEDTDSGVMLKLIRESSAEGAGKN